MSVLCRRRELGGLVVGLIWTLVIGIVATIIGAILLRECGPKPPPTVPDVVGLGAGEAEAALEEIGLEPDTKKVFSLSPVYGVGKIVSQDSPAGASAEAGDSVTLYESKGEPPPSIEIKEIDPGPGGNSRGEATVAVGGFDRRSVVVVWVEVPNDAYYLQGCEQFAYPNPDIAEPVDYTFLLFRPAQPPGQSVRVTVHEAGTSIEAGMVLENGGRRCLPVVDGSLEAQLRQEDYPVVDGGAAGPVVVPAS